MSPLLPRRNNKGNEGQEEPLPAAATEDAVAAVRLRDLLGALASDVTAARAQADAEAMRIARMYRGDPLLRTLPVPLFRLPDLTITMPLLITSIPATESEAALSLIAACAIIQTLILEAIASAGAEIGREQTAEIARALEAERLTIERQSDDGYRDVIAIAERLLRTALTALGSPLRALIEADGSESPMQRELLASARARIVALRASPGVEIAATTADIEAVSSRDSLVQLSVKLSERGVEWAIGEEHERLVPE